ncbi:MAG: glycosyl transferase family 1 [Edaphobacter sp.]|nr:glycosyl transferase family 1 [Edaphobacter sp.]
MTNSDGFGGTEKHLVELIKRMEASGVRSSILQVGSDVYTRILNERGISSATILTMNLQKSPLDWYRLFRIIRPDVLVFVNSWLGSFPWHAVVSACVAGVPKRFAIHHLIAPPLVHVKRKSVRGILKWALGGQRRRRLAFGISTPLCNTTICVSHAVRDRLIKDYCFPASRTLTIHNGISTSEFMPSKSNRVYLRNRLGLGSDDFLLICVARLAEVKGLDILLLSLARLLQQGVACKCIIIGEGPLKGTISKQVNELGLSGHVFLEGFQDDVKPYLQAGDAFVLTSYAEGLPLSILEAMGCGLPCVVTDVGGNSEAITHNVHGFVVAPGSVDEATEAISYLIGHPREREQMSRAVQRRVHEEFVLEDRMAEIQNLILT